MLQVQIGLGCKVPLQVGLFKCSKSEGRGRKEICCVIRGERIFAVSRGINNINVIKRDPLSTSDCNADDRSAVETRISIDSIVNINNNGTAK